MARKRLRSLIGFSLLIAVVFAGGILLRNFFLSRIRDKIQSVVSYDRIRFQALPPSLIIENVRTVSDRPYFSAQRIKIRLPMASLFKSEKPLLVVVERPVVRVEPGPKNASWAGQPEFSLQLPFVLDRAFLREGEFSYSSSSFSFQAKGVQALFLPRGDGLSVRAESKDNLISLGPDRRPLHGRIRLHIEARGNRVLVTRFILTDPEIIVKAKGDLTNARDLQGSLHISFKAGMSALADVLHLPFEWEGRVEGEGELIRGKKELAYTSSFRSDRLVLNGVELGKTNGRIEYNPPLSFHVVTNFQKGAGPREEVGIFSQARSIRGEFKNFHLDPIMAYFHLPWPIISPAWGKFLVDDRLLSVDLEFKDEILEAKNQKYPWRGPAHFVWDKRKDIAFSFPRLETSFGQMEISGKISIGSNIDVTISGDYQDVHEAREFVSLGMAKRLNFPEVRGVGRVEAHIDGLYSTPRVRLDFDLSPAGFADFDVASGRGFVEVVKGTTVGQVQFSDSSYGGDIDFLARRGELDVQIKLDEGDVEKILPRLKLNFPLKGRASGFFRVNQKGQSLRVEGTFAGRRLKFGFAELREVGGKILWQDGVLTFPELAFELYGGRMRNFFSLDFPGRRLELDAQAEKLDLSVFSSRLAGQLSFHLQGKGTLAEEVATGLLTIEGLSYPPLQKTGATGKLRLSFADNCLAIKAEGNLSPGNNDFSVEATIPLSGKDISLNGKGSFSNLELLLPWKGARGKINYLVEIRGVPQTLRIQGAVDFEGPILPFPGFAQALTDYSGLVFVQNNTASIRSFKAKLGGGDLKGSGEIRLGKGGVENVRLTLEGENLLLSPLERIRAQADTSLVLVKEGTRFHLDGDVEVKRLSWRREIFEPLRFSSSPYPQVEKEPGLFDDLTLNLRLKASDNAWMENSLGKMMGRFDLTVIGSVKAPVLLGEIEVLRGEAYFQDRKFEILQGRVSFFNPAMIEPYLNFRCETFVKDYRVTLTLTGPAGQLKPEFSSSPPLPPEDVLALLALGEAFRRPYSTETSSQLGTASLVSFQLTEEAQKRAERLFSLDRFRIDPFLMGTTAEMTARLTLGKKISRDFFIYYSTNLTRQTEEIIRLEWDLGNEFSLVGTRNELGRISVDFKIRKRF
ncbi:MAG: translocation/assembly module TamB domain-containing protein [Candidatus Aminicenantales bacterium]